MRMDVRKEDHVKGDEGAKITLIEYGDFECPYCARAHQALGNLLPRLGKDVRLVYRHMPLTQLHPDAQAAAEAAEAAAAAGKFWEMHDALFEGQDDLGDDALADMAEGIGLDARRFGEDMQARRYQARVAGDAALGSQAGAQRTPTFFINGVHYQGDSDEQSLSEALEQALRS